MIPKLNRPARLLACLARRPLCYAAALVACTLIIYPLYQLHIGNTYIYAFNYIDGTTLIMLGVLILRGIIALWRDTDLQAVSVAWIGALSFVFAFEAIYKLAFFTFPWRMPPAELREFAIQSAIALTASAGFAFGKFRISTLSWIFAGVYVIGGIIWLAVGFPQVYSDANFFTPIVNIPFNHDMIYAISRATKIALCLVYYFFYSHQRPNPSLSVDAAQSSGC
jgi:hypothetical protein